MARKPENQFISSIHEHMVQGMPYRMKNSNDFIAGIADVWYSGIQMDMWVEYKFVEKIPKTEKFRLDLTPRQLEWLRDRHEEGREVVVILGTKEGGVIFEDRRWESTFSQAELKGWTISRKAIAEWIAERTHGTYVTPERGKMRRIADEPVILKVMRKRK